MKKIIFLWWILLPITSSFAFTINPTPTNIEDTAKNWILYLDNWKNTFNKSTSHTNQIQLDQEKNNFKCSSCTFDNITNPLYITCKNWLISKIQWHANHTPNYILTWNFQSLILDYNYSGHEYKSNIILQCKPITQPTKIIESEVLDINYKTIQTPKNNPFESLVLSTSIDPEIDPNKLKKLEPGKEPDSQPTFTDILFLQLKTISNLSDAILTQHPDLSFSWLFTSNTNFENYNKWLDKFSTFSIKTEFEDAFSGAITLKDIWIANNIVKGLYICATSNNCSSVIKFKHSILDKYDPYKFKEIENDIYSWTNNILNASINYYTNLKNICSNTNVWDTFLNTQISSICSKLLSDQIDTNNIENYDLGYSLWIRINNLQKIKDWINPKEWINLKWIFNIYWELNNLTLGTNKLTKVKKVIEEPSLTWKYEELKEIFKIDLKEIKNKKIDDNTKAIEKQQIIQTAIKALTPENPIYKTIKKQWKENIDLLDTNNYQITNWIVEIKDLYLNDNNTNINIDNDNKITSITVNYNNWYQITWLTIKYSDNTAQNYKKLITSNWYPLSYSLWNWWRLRGIYINEWKKNEIEELSNHCIEEWKKCNDYVCWYKNNKIKNCLNKWVKKFNRIIVKYNWIDWKYYASFKEWDD